MSDEKQPQDESVEVRVVTGIKTHKNEIQVEYTTIKLPPGATIERSGSERYGIDAVAGP